VIAGTSLTTQTITGTGSATLQLLNTGNTVVYVTATQTQPAQTIPVTSVTAQGLFSGPETTLQQGQTVVIGGTAGTGSVTLPVGTYVVAGTNGLTTQFRLANAQTFQQVVPSVVGTGNVAATSYTFTVPAAAAPTAPVVPANQGDQSTGYALMPNWPIHLTVPGWRSGNILIQAIAGQANQPVLVTPVLNIGDQDATV